MALDRLGTVGILLWTFKQQLISSERTARNRLFFSAASRASLISAERDLSHNANSAFAKPDDYDSSVNQGQKNSAHRAFYSEFDGIVNPNEKTAEAVLAVLAPLAAIAVIMTALAVFAGVSPTPLAVISIIFYLVTLGRGRDRLV